MAKLVLVLDDGLIDDIRELLDEKGEGFSNYVQQIVCAICDDESCYIAQADCVDDVQNCECCRCYDERGN
jgi:hypothetical protein